MKKNNSKTIFEKFPVLKTISIDKFPKHIFIIPDGNRRWAKIHNKSFTSGHIKGFEVVYNILKELQDIDYIKVVTVWGFSADNWKRSEEEIHGLMLLMESFIKKTLKDLLKKNGRFIHLGRKDRIPKKLLNVIKDAEIKTEKNLGQIVCLAIDFGGEDQEIRIIQKASILTSVSNITQETVWQLRDAGGLVKSADLIIRTSGERRISDLGWINGANSELYFLEKYFPDVTSLDIVDALIDFSKRERRMGGRK